ncbi:MAG: hypothetical protein IAF38_21630 [Bacteroidia bacterium]|nr:hypothetical protein [Bacteroidia bacterium]
MKPYPKEVIEKFTAHVLEKPEGYNFLHTNGYQELLATLDAIRGDEKAFSFLMKFKFFELAGFVNAIWDDRNALKMLLDKKYFEWAAAANIVNGDEKAMEFLTRMGKPHFIALALAIQKRIREDNDKNSNFFSFTNIFKK